MKVGTKGTLTYKDKTIAHVEIQHIAENKNKDMIYWLSYEDGETNKQISCARKAKDKAVFGLKKEILEKVFTPAPEKSKEEDLIDDMGGTRVSKGAVPSDLKLCNVIYDCSIKGQPYNIYVGVENATRRYHIKFGSTPPLVVSRQRMFFILSSFGALATRAMIDEGFDNSDMHKIVQESMEDAQFQKLEVENDQMYKAEDSMVKGNSSELRKDIDQEATEDFSDRGDAELDAQGASRSEDLEKELAEIASLKQDFENHTKEMTEEEKEAYEQTLHKKEEEALDKKASEFEKMLLGKIESDDDVEYNFAYFLEVHKTQGAAALKEELTKLPKEDRDPMIAKIKEEWIQMKKSKSNEETDSENS